MLLERKISLRGNLADDFAKQSDNIQNFLRAKWKDGLIERHEEEDLLLVYYVTERPQGFSNRVVVNDNDSETDGKRVDKENSI